MIIKYAFFNYDEPKKSGEDAPRKLFEYHIDEHTTDTRSEAAKFAEDIYENLNGKEKFRFFIIGENGVSSVYQVNFTSESRDFFESELVDDLDTILFTKK